MIYWNYSARKDNLSFLSPSKSMIDTESFESVVLNAVFLQYFGKCFSLDLHNFSISN